MIKTDTITRCPDCGDIHLIRDLKAGELICERCGLVISSSLLNYGPEWRAFDNAQLEKRTRVGAPITWTMHDVGLSTTIDTSGRDGRGQRLSDHQKAQIYRLRKWHRRSKVSSSSDRNLAYALSELTKAAFKLNLPRNVIETAAFIYRQAVKKRLVRGRSIRGVTAASLYIACRQCNITRSIEEVASATQLSKKETGRIYRYLMRRLNARVPRSNPRDYVSKYVSQLSLSGDTENIALDILGYATELRLTNGRSPAGMAAAATYIASVLMGEKRTQHEYAETGNITEVTIRNRYKELAQRLLITTDM